MKLKGNDLSDDEKACEAELIAALEKYCDKIPAIAMIALMSQILGRMIAAPNGYDWMTTFNVIMANLEMGNIAAAQVAAAPPKAEQH